MRSPKLLRSCTFSILALTAILLSACSHSRYIPEPVEKFKFVRGWTFIESESEFLNLESGAAQVNFSAPVIEGEKLIYGSQRFGLLVLNKFNGHKIWQKKIRNGVSGVPLVYQGKLFVGGDDASFHCFDLSSGNEIWNIELNGMPSVGAPIIVEQRLIVAAADESVHALDLLTGKTLWIYKRPIFTNTSIRGGGNPSFIDGSVWVGFSDGTLAALNPQDGGVKIEKQFRDNLKFMDIDARPIPWRDGILATTYDGKLRNLRHDASLVWEFKMGGARAPLISENGDNIYLPGSDGTVYSILGATAKENWHFSVRYGVPTGLALLEKENALLVSSSVERIYALDISTGRRVGHYDLGRGSGSFSSIVADKETNSFFVLSNFGRIYQFHLEH